MKNIEHMGEQSLENLARNNISAQGKKNLTVDISTSIAGLCFLLAGLLFSKVFPDRPAVPALIYTVGFLIEAIPIYYTSIMGIIRRNMTNAIDCLVAIAITACFFSGELVTSLLIPLILNVSHILEERSIMGGREAIDGLKSMQNTTAVLLLPDGSTETVSSSVLKPGQKILVRPGSVIPADGKICDGETNIDQKTLTGEPEPYRAAAGSSVYAGTMNLDGAITVEVEKGFRDTSFSGIVKLLEEAEKMSVPESRIIDRFMMYYIPLVLSIAAAVALIEKDLSRAIAVLVVSCPCGQMLVASAPLVGVLSAATKKGILIKNTLFLEKIGNVNTVVFDKTGTLTVGEMSVSAVIPCDGHGENEVIGLASALCKNSSHPISRAVLAYSSEDTGALKDIHEYSGKGLEGKNAGGQTVRFGRYEWLSADGIRVPDGLCEGLCGSVSLVTVGECCIGAVVLNDVPRSDSSEAIAALEKLGVTKTVMLTGDRKTSAEKIGSEIGIRDIRSELMPEDKLNCLKELKESGTVMAVGDGINDALALREAHIGVAMGTMGSDLAIHSADIALMNNNLMNIPFTVVLARKTRRIIYENLILSMTVSAVMILLSVFGVIGALSGALLHNVGAFAVILNSSRILRTKI